MAFDLMSAIQCADSYAIVDGKVQRVPSHAETLAYVEQLDALLAAHVVKLRDTARGLRDGSIHPAHAANRLAKMARELGG